MARKAGLTRDEVITAAATIADREGLPAVTLAAVAEVVGVRSPSLYSHVDGLEGLRRSLALLATHLLAEAFADAARVHDDDGRPLDALREIAHAYRAFAREHPGLYASLLPVPKPGDDPEGAAAALESVNIIASLLGRLGIPADRHVDIIRTLRAMLHGFCDLELGGGFGLGAPVDTSFEVAVDIVLRGFAVAQEPAHAP